MYPVRDVVLIEPIGSVLTELIRGELRRDGHIVAESASDQVDVVFGGTVREYRSLYQATAFSQDELSGHVKIDVTLQTATVNTPILSKSYKGYYIERRYESDLSAIKNVLDRALLDMLEGITADEELLRVLGALAR